MSHKYYPHPTARISGRVGKLSRIGAYTQIKGDVGEQSRIGDYCLLEEGASIGSSVLVGDGISVPPQVRIGNRAVLGAHVAFEDLRTLIPGPVPRTLIGEGARIGANTTIVCGVTVGRHAVVEPASVIRQDVPDYAHVAGEGAFRCWVCACGRDLEAPGAGGRMLCSCGLAYAVAEGRAAEYTPVGA